MEQSQLLKTSKSNVISCMNSAIENEYIYANENRIHSKSLACSYNKLLKKITDADNHIAMDLNHAMTIIGNSGNVKELLEIAENQQSSIAVMVQSSDTLTNSIAQSEQILNDIQTSVKTVYSQSDNCSQTMQETVDIVNESYDKILESCESLQGFRKKADRIDEILKIVNDLALKTQLLSLNARVESTKAGEHGRGFGVVANEIKSLSIDTQQSMVEIENYVTEIKNEVESLVTQMDEIKGTLDVCKEKAKKSDNQVLTVGQSMNTITNQIETIFVQTNMQNNTIKDFLSQLEEVSKSSENLIFHCQDPGKDMYKISRTIDKIRGNVARNQAKLSIEQWIDIYIVDHLIFTWRLYNMVAGFEQLQLKNLNQPDKCKFGIWYYGKDMSRFSDNTIYLRAGEAHKKLHDLAVLCYNANENEYKSDAMNYFKTAQMVYQEYSSTMNQLKTLFR